MTINIRDAKENDITSLFPLVQDFATSFKVEEDKFKSAFQSLVENTDAKILIAQESDETIGYCLGFIHHTFYANGKVAWLEEIMVPQSHRRSGVGEILMKHYENWAASEDAKLNALATRRASKFYEAIEYEASATYYRKIL